MDDIFPFDLRLTTPGPLHFRHILGADTFWFGDGDWPNTKALVGPHVCQHRDGSVTFEPEVVVGQPYPDPVDFPDLDAAVTALRGRYLEWRNGPDDEG